MSEVGMPNTLEQEIAQIERDLASKRAALEAQKKTGEIQELPHEKETLREMIGERLSPPPAGGPTSSPSSPLPSQPTPPIPTPVEPPSYLSEELKNKVQQLVDDAFAKSIGEAIKEARTTNNAALIDAFHDALVDELYNQLVERGKLKKI